jgi:hypothetical protein
LRHKRSSVVEGVHLSNYYTDAIFGFECGRPERLDNIQVSSAYKKIASAHHIHKKVRDEMIADCQLALTPDSDAGSCFSSLDEFKYVVERNPRFHMSLAFTQAQFMKTVIPFADIDVLEMAMRAPIVLRERKRILEELLHHVNARVAKIESSANTEYFYGNNSRLARGSLFERYEFKKFRFLNMSAQLLSTLTGGNLRFRNPYQTEDQLSVYHKIFSHLPAAILANDALRECVGANVIEHTFKDRLILRNLAERFTLINFHYLSSHKL